MLTSGKYCISIRVLKLKMTNVVIQLQQECWQISTNSWDEVLMCDARVNLQRTTSQHYYKQVVVSRVLCPIIIMHMWLPHVQLGFPIYNVVYGI